MQGTNDFEVLPSGLVVPRFVKNEEGIMVPREQRQKAVRKHLADSRLYNDGTTAAEQELLHRLVDGNGDLVIANEEGEVVARFRRVDGLPEPGDVMEQVDEILRGKR